MMFAEIARCHRGTRHLGIHDVLARSSLPIVARCSGSETVFTDLRNLWVCHNSPASRSRSSVTVDVILPIAS